MISSVLTSKIRRMIPPIFFILDHFHCINMAKAHLEAIESFGKKLERWYSVLSVLRSVVLQDINLKEML